MDRYLVSIGNAATPGHPRHSEFGREYEHGFESDFDAAVFCLKYGMKMSGKAAAGFEPFAAYEIPVAEISGDGETVLTIAFASRKTCSRLGLFGVCCYFDGRTVELFGSGDGRQDRVMRELLSHSTGFEVKAVRFPFAALGGKKRNAHPRVEKVAVPKVSMLDMRPARWNGRRKNADPHPSAVARDFAGNIVRGEELAYENKKEIYSTMMRKEDRRLLEGLVRTYGRGNVNREIRRINEAAAGTVYYFYKPDENEYSGAFDDLDDCVMEARHEVRLTGLIEIDIYGHSGRGDFDVETDRLLGYIEENEEAYVEDIEGYDRVYKNFEDENAGYIDDEWGEDFY